MYFQGKSHKHKADIYFRWFVNLGRCARIEKVISSNDLEIAEGYTTQLQNSHL
jgi:hypothetical protein